MAYPAAANFPQNAMPGEPTHSVSTGVKKAKTVKVKARVRKIVKRPKKAPVASVSPSPAPPPPDPNQNLIDTAVRLRYGGQENALGQQLAQNARFSAAVPSWYSSALDQIRQQQAYMDQGAMTLQHVLSQYNTPANGDPQAAQARSNLNAAFGQQIGSQALAQRGFLDAVVGGLAAQQNNTAAQAQNQRIGLLGQRGQLESEKGAFATQYKNDLAGAQQKIDNEQANLDLKRDTLDYLQGDRKAKNKIARTNAKTQRINAKTQRINAGETRRQHKIEDAFKLNRLQLDTYKAQHTSSKAKGGNSTYSKSKVQGYRSSWDYARALAHQLKEKRTYKDKASGKNKPVTSDVAYSALLGATKDPDISKAAALLAYGKPLPKDLRHRLAVKGVHPPKDQPSLLGAIGNLLTK